MNNLIIGLMIIILIFLVVEMIFMFKLAKLIGTFLNRFRYLGGEGNIVQHTIGSGQPALEIKQKDQNRNGIDFNNKQHKIIIFKDPYCRVCSEISENLPLLVKQLKRNVELIVIQKENGKGEDFKNIRTIISKDVFTDYNIQYVPTLIIVSDEGVILKRNENIGGFNDLLNEIEIFVKN